MDHYKACMTIHQTEGFLQYNFLEPNYIGMRVKLSECLDFADFIYLFHTAKKRWSLAKIFDKSTCHIFVSSFYKRNIYYRQDTGT